MKLGEGGEAFFVEEADEPVPPNLATSPFPSSVDLMRNGVLNLRNETKGRSESYEKEEGGLKRCQSDGFLDYVPEPVKSAINKIDKSMQERDTEEDEQGAKPGTSRKNMV